MKKSSDVFCWFMSASICLIMVSCSKFVEVDPPITSSNGDNVFNEDETAIAVLTSIYTNMVMDAVNDGNARLTNVFFTTGLAGDEFELWDKTDPYFGQWFYNTISPLENSWAKVYNMIFIANSAISGLQLGRSLTKEVRQQLLGEAKFVRALSYFYLVNLYGDVPLVVSTDYKVNRILPRLDKSQVYQQIVADLEEAKDLLKDKFVGRDGVSETEERVRPNKWAAMALLARVYLYIKQYQKAEKYSSEVINNSVLFSLEPLDNVFLMNNKEALWQLQPVGNASDLNANSQEGKLLKLFDDIGPDQLHPIYLTENLVNSFEDGDLRRTKWVGVANVGGVYYHYPYKYKIGREDEPTKEYTTVLRLGEQYLIRAESRVELGKIDDGISDLNVIRMRATDVNAPITDRLKQLPFGLSKLDALDAIQNERRHELFSEWGHRWFDLKRVNRINDVMQKVKQDWQSTDQLYPIPQGDINDNPNLRGHQNPGYN